MAKFSRHIKQDSIRSIILQDTPCESKLGEIQELVGLPPATENTNDGVGQNDEEGSAGQVEDTNESSSLRDDSIKRILEGLTGRELSIGRNLLQEIEKTPGISWDETSLELILNGQNISFSNMNLLVNKVVQSSSLSLPIGLVSFLNSLVMNKFPLSYIRDADSKNIRQALVEINGKTGSTESAPVVDANEGSNIQSVDNLEAEKEVESSKRKREEDSDFENEITEEQLTKKQKISDESKNTGEEQIVDPRRRSSRIKLKLKKEYEKNWRELNK